VTLLEAGDRVDQPPCSPPRTRRYGVTISGRPSIPARLLALLTSSLLILAIGLPFTVAVAAHTGLVGGMNVEPGIRPWQYLGANPQSWWCSVPNCTGDFDVSGDGPIPTIEAELADAKALGAAEVRFEWPWPLLEPQSGVFDWSRADAIVAASRLIDEPILPVFLWTPQWAGGGPQLNQPPGTVAEWVDFVTASVQRYGRDFSKGIEIWNEADSGRYLTGSVQTYVADVLNPAYAAAKRLDPALPIVLGGSINDSGNCCAFLSAVIRAGGKFDVATFHNYSGTWSKEAESYRSILDGAGRSATPIWLTEFGVESSQGSQTSAIQAVFGGSLPLEQAFWYNLRDTGAYRCCPPSEAASATWGILDANFTPKPSYGLLQSMLGGTGKPITPADELGRQPAAASNGSSPTGSVRTPGRRASPAESPSATPIVPWPILGGVAVACLLTLVVGMLAMVRRRARASRGSPPRLDHLGTPDRDPSSAAGAESEARAASQGEPSNGSPHEAGVHVHAGLAARTRTTPND
jgi:hypothetical protein